MPTVAGARLCWKFFSIFANSSPPKSNVCSQTRRTAHRLLSDDQSFRRGQRRAPYLEALKDHLDQKVLSFHVPGHQQGRGAPDSALDFLGESAFRADITEVLGIDDLHHPTGQCGEAQELAAEAFGADLTRFLVNGSTSGNQAMFLTCLGPEDTVLIPRNAHRSAWAAAVICGVQVAVYDTPFDDEMEVFHPPTVSDFYLAYEQCPQAKALYLVSPSYYGGAADLESLVAEAHDRGLLVLVDEAWGGHFAFHPGLPTSAVTAGADLTVQSTHKMLPGLTQGAMLHLRGQAVDRSRLDSVLGMLLTSSPSSLLVASLDSARREYSLRGHELLEGLLNLSAHLRRMISEIEGIVCHGEELLGRPEVHQWDFTRLVVSAVERGFTGYELESTLRYEHHLQVEMSDHRAVVIVLSAGHGSQHGDRLVEALRALPHKGPLASVGLKSPTRPRRALQVLSPRETFFAPHHTMGAEEAVGLRSAETIHLYPPGIPWVLPGEVIESEVLAQLKGHQQMGGRVRGAADSTLATLKVLKGI